MSKMHSMWVAAVAMTAMSAFVAGSAWAKLPPPSDEAKAKAAEAAAKTAHGGKVDGYKLCLSMDRVAKGYFDRVKKDGKTAPPAATTAPCADPGVFVYTPPAPASAPAAMTAAAPVPATAPATASAAAPKK